ncbi:MAG: 4-(cytidine 5'-diphospho)-2-C-methyl-D-erythritol kinase [Oscillospiraceae bacterium]|nr:4-(cytidine 5'-diphospho)-2-C-methyl-D-erythritol kinase [Oscillospiraceae bacterium]
MADKLTVKTYAKVNLTLDVTGRRDDGYHEIDSIFEEISLHDTLEVSVDTTGKIKISCTDASIPCDERNIVYKACRLFFDHTGQPDSGASISIIKNIPSQAGMGGGSTNAAGVLKALNTLTGAGLTDDELAILGAGIGADVPFFIYGGLAHVCGIGERISVLDTFPKHFIVCAKGHSGISTKTAYQMIDSLHSPVHQNSGLILELLQKKDIAALMKESVNTFELVTDLDDVNSIMTALTKYNCLGARMSGSGSSVFGIFDEHDCAVRAYNELKERFEFAYLAENIIRT